MFRCPKSGPKVYRIKLTVDMLVSLDLYVFIHFHMVMVPKEYSYIHCHMVMILDDYHTSILVGSCVC